jgi:hypothetical protein
MITALDLARKGEENQLFFSEGNVFAKGRGERANLRAGRGLLKTGLA